MAGVAEHDGPRLAVGAGDQQDRHVVIDWPLGVGAKHNALVRRLPAVGGKGRRAVADGHRRRAEVGQGRSHHLDQRIDQPIAIFHELPAIMLVGVEHNVQIIGNGGAAMRVRRIEQELAALQAVFRLHPRPPCRTSLAAGRSGRW